ncbi:fibronectin type III domain-containing protein [Georgenia muralis]
MEPAYSATLECSAQGARVTLLDTSGLVVEWGISINGTFDDPIPGYTDRASFPLAEGQYVSISPQLSDGTFAEPSEFIGDCFDGQPGVVGSLRAVAYSPTGIDVTWAPPAETGAAEVTGYVVEVFKDDLVVPGAGIDVSGTRGTVFGLEPDTTYTVHVAAVNSAGTGTAAVTLVTTLASTVVSPPSVVRDLVVEPTSPTSAELTWSPPVDTGGADLLRYETVLMTGGVLVTSVDPFTMETSMAITGLTPGATYTFSISASGTTMSAGPISSVEFTMPAVAASGYFLSNTLDGVVDVTFGFGSPTDVDVYMGDWDGDGTDTPAYRRGNLFSLRNSNSAGEPDRQVAYGRTGDIVYVGDWDGDGDDTFAVRRGNTFYLANTFNGGPADVVTAYGRTSDLVLVGDWDGDGVDTPSVRRGNTYYLKNDFSGGAADIVTAYGRATDEVHAGDWDGDGMESLLVRRGSTYYVKNDFSGGNADASFDLGVASDRALVGDFDGDGKDTVGYFRAP